MPTSGDTNYPPGVTGNEPVFWDEDAPCSECGHLPDDHNEGVGPCEVRGCRCEQYEPFEEDPYGY